MSLARPVLQGCSPDAGALKTFLLFARCPRNKGWTGAAHLCLQLEKKAPPVAAWTSDGFKCKAEPLKASPGGGIFLLNC